MPFTCQMNIAYCENMSPKSVTFVVSCHVICSLTSCPAYSTSASTKGFIWRTRERDNTFNPNPYLTFPLHPTPSLANLPILAAYKLAHYQPTKTLCAATVGAPRKQHARRTCPTSPRDYATTRHTNNLANNCLQVKRTVKLVTEQRVMYTTT